MDPAKTFLILLVSSAFVPSGVAQSDSVDTAAAPVFRSQARLVEVSVVATGKNAKSIALTKEDFTLLDESVHQEVAVFSSRSGVSTGRPGRSGIPFPSQCRFKSPPAGKRGAAK
jgi:hypothetical protein